VSLTQANAQDAKPDTLTEAQAIAQVEEWIASGMPRGMIVSSGPVPGRVGLLVETTAAVDVWCAAMQVDAVRNGGSYGTPVDKPRPVLMPGWCLDVWCSMPDLGEPAVRIEVAS
jgi:hypothetical protein